MAMTRRASIAVGAVTALLLATAALAYYALFPQKAPAFVRTTLETVGLADESPPPLPTCPLTGVEPAGGRVPRRPALAVKIENHPSARPQASLNQADVVYEEPVEGGYTRFIAVFHCDEVERVGPVRSGRTTDPDVLRQYGPAVFGYAGGVAAVKREVPRAGLVDVNYIDAAEAYVRDPTKAAPHDLYTTTSALREAAGSDAGAPRPVFTYAATYEGRARRAAGVHLEYSSVSDVVWTWGKRQGVWLRAHGDVPHVLEDGSQVAAGTVIVQVVEVTAGTVIDAAGNPSPDVELTGKGRAYVFRDGAVIVGRWERPSLEDLTRFVTKDGEEVPVSPGRTWVELLPSTVPVEILR